MSTSDLLAADTSMGAVTLLVADLDGMTAYYRDAVALTVLPSPSDTAAADTVALGRGTTPLIILRAAPELIHASPRDAGLFHTAILFDSEAGLAASVYSVATKVPGSFTGSSDHLVSKAFYFTDPEGNGIDSAREFYVNRLGFEQTILYGDSALFVSAGGYHHHMAMNTWNSAGAGRRGRTLGLGRVDIVVPGADDLASLGERMSHHGIATRNDGQTLSFDDPWANVIRVTASSS